MPYETVPLPFKPNALDGLSEHLLVSHYENNYGGAVRRLESRRLSFSFGAGLALLSAVLFGASTPLAKVLLGSIEPWLLAAVLHLGSGADHHAQGRRLADACHQTNRRGH